MNTASQTSRDGNAIAQLDREWNATADRALADALTRWQQHEPVLRPFSGPRQLLGFLHTAKVPDTDEPRSRCSRSPLRTGSQAGWCCRRSYPR